jgi:hypothetical protein
MRYSGEPRRAVGTLGGVVTDWLLMGPIVVMIILLSSLAIHSVLLRVYSK